METVAIEFFYNGKLLLSAYSQIYPNYSKGDVIEVALIPTERERTRRPAQKRSYSWFQVDKVSHKVYETDAGEFALKMEVLLIDVSDANIDADSRETSIPRRLLKRDK